MSLSKLPDLVKSQICSFLDFNDIKKLQQTTKINQAFLKRYKLDKPKIDYLSLTCCYSQVECILCIVVVENYTTGIDLPRIECLKDQDIHTPKVLNLINKFHSIDHVVFDSFDFHEDSGWSTIQTKIRYAEFTHSGIFAAMNTRIDFLKKFERIKFSVSVEPSFLNDELFAILSDNGTTLLFGECRQDVALTDLTLDTLTSRRIPEEICFSNLTADFSIEKIKNIIEVAFTSGLTRIDWNLGTLKKEKFYEIQRFMNEKFMEWSDGLHLRIYFKYYDDIFYESEYSIHHREKNTVVWRIDFAVYTPEELWQRGAAVNAANERLAEIGGEEALNNPDDEGEDEDDSGAEDEGSGEDAIMVV